VRTWITIPTCDEVENIDLVLRRVRAAVPDATILVADDSSPDGTADKAEALAAELGSIHVLRRPAHLGLGGAYREGFAAGLALGHDVVVEIDGDLAHDPADIPRLLRAVEHGADLAIGSRYVVGGNAPHWHSARRAMSRLGNRAAAWALGLEVHDATSGLRAYRSSILERIDYASTRTTGYAFHVELTHRVRMLGANIVEIPISAGSRVRGRTKVQPATIARAAVEVTAWGLRSRLRSRAPRHH
jgi:dolichol-phosphate mannosyltransferase